jgi:ABC-type lipoprotein release transport system permease subunit
MMQSTTTTTMTRAELAAPPEDRGPNPLYALVQWFAGLLVPLLLLRLVRPVVSPRRPGTRGSFLRPLVLFVFAGLWFFLLANTAATFALKGFPPFDHPPKLTPPTIWTVGGAIFRAMIGVLQTQSVVLMLDWLFFRSFPNVPAGLRVFDRALKRRISFERGIFSLIGTLFVIGFSLLPLTALLAALPAVSPSEAVLSETVRPARTRWARLRRRVLAVVAGLVVLIALFAFSLTLVWALPLPEGGQLAALSKKVLGTSVVDTLMPDVAFDKPPPDQPADQPWQTTEELLERQKTLEETTRRPNRSPAEVQETDAKLAEVDKQIEKRAATAPKMRVLLAAKDWRQWDATGRDGPPPDARWGIDPKAAWYLATPIWQIMPPVLVQHWPFVLLITYATDLGLLLLIGRVPLAYNFRYLWVRKRDTALTALAFTVVVALVVVLLAFVNGMYKLNEGTGVPGNVMVLSDGATDELWSNLSYGDVTNVERVVLTEDEKGRPLPKAVGVARGTISPDGRFTPATTEGSVYLASYETYLVMNQPVPQKEGEKPRRRFLQVRALKSGAVAAAVHNIELEPGGQWFADNGVHKESSGRYLPCVIGEGVAGTLGPDAGKARLSAGDTFNLGDRDWIVLGVMKTRGTTYGSEVWTSIDNVVVKAAGKGDKYTTLVLRMADNSDASGRAMAYHVQYHYDQAKLKAYSEPEYYKELTKTNETFLTWIVALASVMAVGGVFGVMNTMFASIAARIKEVGVLRILGFKRWQILISFMLESLTIAAVGGLIGCALGYLANGFEASSTLSGGGGGGKSVALTMVVDYQTLAAGMLFTLIMGRLGGLVPALSAMRMEILDSLR